MRLVPILVIAGVLAGGLGALAFSQSLAPFPTDTPKQKSASPGQSSSAFNEFRRFAAGLDARQRESLRRDLISRIEASKSPEEKQYYEQLLGILVSLK